MGRRISVVAEVGNFGNKKNWHGYYEQTVCFINLEDKVGNKLCEHLWFTIRKRIAALNLEVGDKVEFEATVKSYLKGYKGRRDDVHDKPLQRDYKLSNPTKMVKLKKVAAESELLLDLNN